MYDLIIIGAGPAGMTAAVYAARKHMNFLVISTDIGGQTLWSSAVENYLGYQYISGMDLVKKFEDHIKEYTVELKLEKVIELELNESELSQFQKSLDHVKQLTKQVDKLL